METALTIGLIVFAIWAFVLSLSLLKMIRLIIVNKTKPRRSDYTLLVSTLTIAAVCGYIAGWHANWINEYQFALVGLEIATIVLLEHLAERVVLYNKGVRQRFAKQP